MSADERIDARRNGDASPEPDQLAIPPMMTTQSYMPASANFEDRWPYAEMAMGFNQRNTPLVLQQAATYSQPQEHPGQNGSASIFPATVGMQGAGETSRADTKPQPGSLEMHGHAPKVILTTNPRRPVRIARPPAGRLESALRFIVPRETFQRMVAPLIADAHHEYFEDLLRKDLAHARWVLVRLYLTIGYNVLWALLASITRVIRRAG